MGNAGSTTKLHVDRGGLDITIGMIVQVLMKINAPPHVLNFFSCVL